MNVGTSGEPSRIDNWSIEHVFLDESMQFTAPTIQGVVKGRPIKKDLLLWFDLENKIAMTRDTVYAIGDPNPFWMGNFLAAGNDIEDLEIKSTMH